MPERTPVDQRELSDDTVKPAVKGEPGFDNVKAATTWIREARRNLDRSIDYYARAQEYLSKAQHYGQASECDNVIAKLKEQRGRI